MAAMQKRNMEYMPDLHKGEKGNETYLLASK